MLTKLSRQTSDRLSDLADTNLLVQVHAMGGVSEALLARACTGHLDPTQNEPPRLGSYYQRQHSPFLPIFVS